MTDQEIEKLREKLGSEYSVKRLNGAITVELVDIWEGVEFSECIDDSDIGNDVTIGKVYKCKIVNDELYIIDDKGEEDGFIRYEENFKPSTESAYVEQLRAKAKKLYGDIKNGDRFVLPWIANGNERNIHLEGKYDFYYYKKSDTLELHGFPLYNQGKWAKKIERVRVVPSEIHYPKPDNLDQYVTVELRIIGGLLDSTKSKGAIDELAKCLEDYLNKIP